MTSVKEDAEKYSEYVRQQLGDTLSQAVTDILLRRPSDPITYIARRLYDLRRRRPLRAVPAPTTTIGASGMSGMQKPRSRRGTDDEMSMITVRNKPSSSQTGHSKVGEKDKRDQAATKEAQDLLQTIMPAQEVKDRGHVFITGPMSSNKNDDEDDFIDEDMFEYRTSSNVAYVHEFLHDKFHKVNDLFDDGDIT